MELERGRVKGKCQRRRRGVVDDEHAELKRTFLSEEEQLLLLHFLIYSVKLTN